MAATVHMPSKNPSSTKKKIQAAPPVGGTRKSSRPPPPAEPIRPATVEERIALINERLERQDPVFLAEYRESFDMSWIYHDSAIEGTVYTYQELRGAFDRPLVNGEGGFEGGSGQPIVEEIRRHRQAIEFIRVESAKKKEPMTIDFVKQLYLILHPEEGDVKTVRYRKDIPQHRLYFHEYAAPDKISNKVKAVVDWINDPESKKGRSAVRFATRAHYDLLRVFPFTNDSGKVARLIMNLLLLRASAPPAICHSTERQRYYEALKGSSSAMTQIVQEAIDNNLASVEKLLDKRASIGAIPIPR